MDEGFLRRAEAALLRNYLNEIVVPIFYGGDEGLSPLGTGTLLEISDRLFLLTAAHIFEDEKGETIDTEKLVTSFGRKSGKTSSLGDHRYVLPKSSDKLDMALVEIEYPTTIADFRENYQRLTLDQIDAPTRGAQHVLVGFPESMTKIDDNQINQRPLRYFTELLEGPPNGLVQYPNPALDLFFRLDRTGQLPSGEVHDMPRLGGASGAVIWEFRPYEGPLWTPAKCLKAIGIQRSEKPSDGWFRATRCLPLAQLVAQFDRQAAAELAVRLIGPDRVEELLGTLGLAPDANSPAR